jgi:hypothetical protein
MGSNEPIEKGSLNGKFWSSMLFTRSILCAIAVTALLRGITASAVELFRYRYHVEDAELPSSFSIASHKQPDLIGRGRINVMIQIHIGYGPA